MSSEVETSLSISEKIVPEFNWRRSRSQCIHRNSKRFLGFARNDSRPSPGAPRLPLPGQGEECGEGGRCAHYSDLDHEINLRRSISNAACATSCLNVSRSLGKNNSLTLISLSDASAT